MSNNVISFSEFRFTEPYTEFSKSFQESYPERMEGIKSGEYKVIPGTGCKVSWKSQHDCNCEYCDHEEFSERFYTSKEDSEKKIKVLRDNPDYFWDIEVEEVRYVKAVKQNAEIEGGLF